MIIWQKFHIGNVDKSQHIAYNISEPVTCKAFPMSVTDRFLSRLSIFPLLDTVSGKKNASLKVEGTISGALFSLKELLCYLHY